MDMELGSSFKIILSLLIIWCISSNQTAQGASVSSTPTSTIISTTITTTTEPPPMTADETSTELYLSTIKQSTKVETTTLTHLTSISTINPIEKSTNSTVQNTRQTINQEISTTQVYNDNITALTNTTDGNTTESMANNLLTTISAVSYLSLNGTCRLGFVLQSSTNMCVYLCKDKVCENGGECAVVTDATGNSPAAICRCKQDDDVEYSGDNCEISKISRLKERKITLGVLIPLAIIFLLLTTCACVKLKRLGKTPRDSKSNYELNAGSL